MVVEMVSFKDIRLIVFKNNSRVDKRILSAFSFTFSKFFCNFESSKWSEICDFSTYLIGRKRMVLTIVFDQQKTEKRIKRGL